MAFLFVFDIDLPALQTCLTACLKPFQTRDEIHPDV
jgi:hypothetical protein